jgi:uncharacterized protein involved in exopolysaccharide biosynthesis
MAGLALCGVGLWLLFSPAQYRATASIQINPDVTDINQIGQGMSYDPYFIQTEFEVLQSQVVLGRVISSLNLNVEWGKRLSGGGTLTTNESIAILKRHLNLAIEQNAKLIEISFTSQNPDEAAKIANAIAKAFQDYRINQRKENTANELAKLEQQYQFEETEIQIQQTNVDLLREKLKIQENSSPSPNQSETFSGSLSNYGNGSTNALAEQPYWEAKRVLENNIEFRKVLAAKIKSEKLDLQVPTTTMVQIVDAAQPPELPTSPNRFLGAALLAIGLFPTVGGFLIIKSARRPSA